MPKARHYGATEGVGTVGFASCSCGWFISRPTFAEAAQAASVHDVLRHSARPIARPTW
jgi:hypothetical protein